MKTNRKTMIGVAVAATLATVAATTVFAHGKGYWPGAGPGHGQMMGGQGHMMGGPGMMGGQGHMMDGPGRMGGAGAMMGGRQGMMFGDHTAHAEQRLANFKAQLGITAEQEPVWNDFADTVRAQAKAMNERHQAMAGGGTGFGFTEHFAQMQAGAAQMEVLAANAKALYSALTPAQQAKADGLTTGGCWR